MQRRTVLTGGSALLVTAIADGRDVRARPASALPEDTLFMRMALDEAAKAAFPFGAVIVKDGKVLARGHNRTGVDRDPTAHGEMVAIRAFLAEHGPEAIKGATVYTSGEPCCMCMGALIWCGVERLVYAASLNQISTKLDQIGLSAEDVASKAPFAPIAVVGGVLGNEAISLFK